MEKGLLIPGEKNFSISLYKHIDPLKKKNFSAGLFELDRVWYY